MPPPGKIEFRNRPGIIGLRSPTRVERRHDMRARTTYRPTTYKRSVHEKTHEKYEKPT